LTNFPTSLKFIIFGGELGERASEPLNPRYEQYDGGQNSKEIGQNKTFI
tara:strand:- start:810 stop:956 length:147 start_codon:yes stop_codon:yes gene_type:complete